MPTQSGCAPTATRRSTHVDTGYVEPYRKLGWARGSLRCIVETKTLEDRANIQEQANDCLAPEADREDLALAEQALQEYEAKGIEDTIPYSEYRAKRLGAAS